MASCSAGRGVCSVLAVDRPSGLWLVPRRSAPPGCRMPIPSCYDGEKHTCNALRRVDTCSTAVLVERSFTSLTALGSNKANWDGSGAGRPRLGLMNAEMHDMMHPAPSDLAVQ